MRGHVHLNEVKADIRRGIQDGVNGTPTIFIDGRRYDGPRDRTSMLAAIIEQSPAMGEELGFGAP
jgi:protein-disulfide isomerase